MTPQARPEDPPKPVLEVLEPGDNATVSAEQPVRVRIKNRVVTTYDAYWFVDPQDRHLMKTNDEDQVKYDTIDFSGWTWNKSGQYRIEFRATEHGKVIASAFTRVRVIHQR